MFVQPEKLIPKLGQPRTPFDQGPPLERRLSGLAQGARERLGSTLDRDCQAQLKKLPLRPNFGASRLSIILP
jgi:hypothetical protein